MTVARDAVLEGSFSSGTPATLSFTPVGTPRGITVVIAHGVVSTDLITSVTYGGVTMTRINTAVDTAGEAGRVYTYFLGASIPTGTQTVSIVHTGSADVKWFCVQSVTAAADTEVVTSGVLQAGNQADPQIALNTGATTALRNSILYSGLPTPTTDFTVLSGMETITAANTHDFGAFCALFGEQTTAGSGSFTIGYTSLTDDVAMAAIAIQEVAGGGTQSLTGSLFTKAPTFFTGLVTSVRNLAGALFTKAPTFFTGTVTATRTLTGTLFTKAPTFPTGAVSLAASPQTVNGVLFTKAPTFPQGAVTSTYALTGTLFVKAPTFFTGTVTAGTVTLNGTLFVKAPTFPTGVVTAGAVNLTGVLFQKAPTFPTGTVTTTVSLTGSLFVKTPTFFTGTIGQAGTLFGTLFQKAPTFFTGTLAQGAPSFWQPDPAGWTANPSGFVRVGRYGPSPWGAELSGQRFEKAPTFPVGVVS